MNFVPLSKVAVGIDIGSTNTKVVLAAADGPRVALSTPTPTTGAALESAVIDMVRSAVEASPRPPEAVGITSMAETGQAVGEDGPLTPLLRWDEQRDAAPIERLVAGVGADALFEATGVRPGPKPPLAAWLALREARPETFTAMRSWQGVADLVHLALTGVLRTDHTLAGRTLAYRLPTAGAELAHEFDAELLALVGLCPGQLPRVGLPGDALDVVTAEAARATGLRQGTPVLVAGHDHQVGAWAAGVRAVGDVADSVGTAEAVLSLVGEAPDRVAIGREGMSLVRALDGQTEALLAGSPSAGAFLQWLATHTGHVDVDSLLAGIDEQPLAPQPGWWLPYPAGRQCPRPAPTARPRRVGPAGHPGAEALEATALQAAWLLRAQHELTTSANTGRLRLLGEPVRRQPRWAAVRATLTPLPTELADVAEPVATAAALLALVRSGQADANSALPVRTVEPWPGQAEAWARRLHEFTESATTSTGEDQ